MHILKKSALIALNALLVIAIGSGCVSNTKPKGQNNLSSAFASKISTASSVPLTGDVFMQYVESHNYKVLPNSEAGGPGKLIPVDITYYTKQITNGISDITNKVDAVYKRADEDSKKLGFNLSLYQGVYVDFHSCGIDLGNNKSAEADCFTYNNKIIGFWIFTPTAAAKDDYDSNIIMNYETTYSFSVDFINSNIGYLNVYDSVTNFKEEKFGFKILKTNDEGKNWSIINNNTSIQSLHFANEQNGYGITENNQVEKTEDGGLTWSPSGFFTDKSVYDIDIINSKVMFLIAGTANQTLYSSCFNQLYRTVDGGKRWTKINLPVSSKSYSSDDFCWISSQSGYALYYDNLHSKKVLFYTDNCGKTWAIKKSSNYPDSFGSGSCSSGFKFFSDGVGYIGQDDGKLIRTVDGGKNFTELAEYNKKNYLSFNTILDFINSDEGYTSFEYDSLYHTSDGGEHWNKIFSEGDLRPILSNSY